MLESFSFDLPARLRFGCGVMDEIAKSPLPGKRPLLVTGGKTIRENGTLDRLLTIVCGKAESVTVFDEVSANPTLASVMKGAALAREKGIDCVIALGGGSSMDTGKGIAAMAVNDGTLWDYTASGSGAGKKLENKPLPLIAIPTTAGTGSEGNKTAVITDSKKNEKIGVRTDFVTMAYVDPELTLSIPPSLTAAQGFDAFCHNLEAYISVKANPLSDAIALSGMKAVYNWLPKAVANGRDIEARYHVCYGSTVGGTAIYISSATTIHTMEHMLSGMNPKIAHGVGLAILFDEFHAVVSAHAPRRYAEIALELGLGDKSASEEENAAELLSVLSSWKNALGLGEQCLADYGFTDAELDEMVRMTHWVGGGPLKRDRYQLTDADLSGVFARSMRKMRA